MRLGTWKSSPSDSYLPLNLCENHVFLLTPSLTPSFVLHLFFIYLFRSVQTRRLFYSMGYDTLLSFILMLKLYQYWPLGAPFSQLLCLLWHNPHHSWRSSLVPGKKCSRLNLHFSCLYLGKSQFSKESWSSKGRVKVSFEDLSLILMIKEDWSKVKKGKERAPSVIMTNKQGSALKS